MRWEMEGNRIRMRIRSRIRQTSCAFFQPHLTSPHGSHLFQITRINLLQASAAAIPANSSKQ